MNNIINIIVISTKMICVLCYECSEDLSEIYPFYNLVKNKYCGKLINDINIDVDKLDFKTDVLVKFEFILEALQINKSCCRVHILGNTEFDSLI
jgi:DNA-directed RNA polymerase subunit N (RpoN/RPB10)